MSGNLTKILPRPYVKGGGKVREQVGVPAPTMKQRQPLLPPTKAMRKKAPAKRVKGQQFVELVDLRKEARDKRCEVQLPGCRRWATEYTVLAHIRLTGICGTALKPPDTIAAWSCDHCHDILDMRAPMPAISVKKETIENMQRRLAHYDAMARTLYALHEHGYRMRKAP